MVARAFTAASEKPAGSIGGGGSGVSSGTHCLWAFQARPLTDPRNRPPGSRTILQKLRLEISKD